MMQELAAPFDFGQNFQEIAIRKKSRKVSISLDDPLESLISRFQDINLTQQKDI
jgi:hypothetical protein